MKKALLAAALMSAGIVAHAQSSVTMYGRLDAGIQYRQGIPGGNAVQMESGDWGESEFGLKGAEDLGGGTKAIFKLEMGLNVMNGNYQNGSLFGREARVGLTNDNYGTFKIGYAGASEIIQDSWDIDPQLMQQYAIATLVRGRNWAQAGNSVEYTSPLLAGLTLKGQYDLANSANWNGNGGSGSAPGQLGNTSGFGSGQGRSDGFKAQYNASSFELQALYDEIRDPYGRFSNVYLYSRSIMAGGTYTLGPVKLYAGYQHLSAPDADEAGYDGAASPGGASLPTAVDHEWGGAAWQLSAATALTAAVYHANANNGNGNATLYTLAGTYNLSKRTFFYTELGYIHNSSTSNIGLGNGYADPYGASGASNASGGGAVGGGINEGPGYGHSQFAANVGIMTQF
ncbi:porin [Paraburkholderia ferrariae]|uniref:porin n=1 Tax=Paraburkholderia ferrariae TaxID=386056 RepID=UPI0004864528|nr:porin [Paraburkholderia ferrariae]